MYLFYDYSRTWVEKYTFKKKKKNLVTGKFWCHIPGLLVKEQSPKSSGMLFRILAEIKLSYLALSSFVSCLDQSKENASKRTCYLEPMILMFRH